MIRGCVGPSWSLLVIFYLFALRSMALLGLHPPVRRLLVIGSGAAGLVSGNECRKAGLDVTVYEKESYVGGVWRYYPGSIMYNSLRTNLPKEIMAYNHENPFNIADTDRSYITHADVQNYLESFALKHSLHELISFNTEVTKVMRTTPDSPNRWTVECLITNVDGTVRSIQNVFDAVIVCNGHYSTPLIPHIPGLTEYFTGETYHSKNYDSIRHSMSGKSVLVVGARSSGTDMARELQSLAAIVYVSDRNYTSNFENKIDDKLILLPALQSCDENGLLAFVNVRQKLKIDVILWCTGYSYDFPFLFQSDGKTPLIPRGRCVPGLYQHLFRTEDESRLCCVGLPWAVVPFPLSYLQARWIAAVYTRQVNLPPKEEQLEWLQQFEEQLELPERYHYMGVTQWDYMRMIAKETLLDQDEVYMRHLQVSEEIYCDNAAHRPPYVGAPDAYRNRKYRMDR